MLLLHVFYLTLDWSEREKCCTSLQISEIPARWYTWWCHKVELHEVSCEQGWQGRRQICAHHFAVENRGHTQHFHWSKVLNSKLMLFPNINKLFSCRKIFRNCWKHEHVQISRLCIMSAIGVVHACFSWSYGTPDSILIVISHTSIL